MQGARKPFSLNIKLFDFTSTIRGGKKLGTHLFIFLKRGFLAFSYVGGSKNYYITSRQLFTRRGIFQWVVIQQVNFTAKEHPP